MLPSRMKPPTSTLPHSADQFGPQRDFWWNRDFLDLMAKRWRLREASSLADIGCGLCHWSRLLYGYLRAPARFAGVDREARWVAEAPQLFRNAFPDASPDLLSFQQGDATRLPWPDDNFEVVTCQTVLMHLPRPLEALREMLRILRPGGLLLCVEPNNFWNNLPFTSLTAEEPVEAIVRQFEFWLRCHRGRIAAGRGDHSIGDLLPGYFAQLGLVEIDVHLSDRPAAMFPHYNTPAQKALLDEEQKWKDSPAGPWDPEDLRRLLLLGGGSEEFFTKAIAEMRERFNRQQHALANGSFHAGYGSVSYLVSGRKL